MGEKGNLDTAGSLAGQTTSGMVERTTTTIVSTVGDTTTQLADTIRTAGIEAVADHTVAEARARLVDDKSDESTPPEPAT